MDASAKWSQISAWRREQRAALIARRVALPAAQRREWSAAISACLESCFPRLAEMTVGFCWPYRG